MRVKEKYIPAAVAYRKLKYAKDENTAVYMYGATGYGKTRMVQEFLKQEKAIWLKGPDEDWDLSLLDENGAKGIITVVIDDIQFLGDEEKRDEIRRLIDRDDIWTVIIGRMPTPQWLMSQIAGGQLIIIPESSLELGETEIAKIAKAKELDISAADIRYISENAFGNAFAVTTALEMLKSGEILNADFMIHIHQIFADHIENWVIPQWSMDIQEFLMKLSVVDEFTLPLAVMITGDDQSAQMLKEVANLGNFLEFDGQIYRLRTLLITALRKRALEVFGLNEYNRYVSNAGLYYETRDDILNALRLYEMCDKKENIRALLIRNGRRHAGAGFYWELRRYYLALEDSEVENSPTLMCAMSLLYSLLMNADKSEYWYDRLKHYAGTVKAGEKRETDEMLIYLDISLPHRGSTDMIDIMKRSFSLLKSGGMKLPELSVTNNSPTAMNGGKDFCEWSKRDQFLADTIGTIVEHVNGKMGRGLVHAALCESFYEKGGKDGQVAHHAMLVQMDIEGGGKKEVLFVAVGIQARLSMITGNRTNAFHILKAFEERVRDDNNEAMMRNIRALRCRIALMAGDNDIAKVWMKEAPDEFMDFCTLDRYRYMTKVLCYLAFGNNQEAIALMDKLSYYAQINHRTYYIMEIGLLRAIANKREGLEWKEAFIDTLKLIEEYDFVRIVSEKGSGILPLLKEIKKEYSAIKKANNKWFGRIMEEAELVAGKYPGYLNSETAQPSEFSTTALTILRMQAGGDSIKEIAQKLQMSERTIKYHAAENYRKLNAKGKTDAVQTARSMNLI